MRIFYFCLIVLIFLNCSRETSEIPVADIENGKFAVIISQSGEVRAKKSTIVESPNIRGYGKIMDMVPEGTIVKKNDYLLTLDPEDLLKNLESKETELSGLKAELEKSNANHEFQIKQMELSLENAEYRFELEKMAMKRIEFESKSVQEEKELQFKITNNNYVENKEKLKLQKVINATERTTLMSKYRKVEMELEMMQKDIDRLKILAPEDGLVVYAKVWKNGKFGKIQIGDTPWRGQGIVELPDLSEIEVDTYINEVDISRVKVGMKVLVYLDAFKDSEYKGEIVSISRLARDGENGNDTKVFDVVVKILEVDDKLRPGMSARCEIFLAEYDDLNIIPIESVFTEDSLHYVYLKDNGSFKKVEVDVVDKNDTHVGIKNKLSGKTSLTKP
ncbi:MAG: HlyD family efflux transporter periplasmic adaptor subunit [Candidatus Delongbacteria bacterium]|nr:HlyD family efflux transporter periplasmic adaptor subunit [Candidatus Delongbacteria bacterium]MBN2834971.1 HlyD family efflux transporter periplasmic adaptor subunit [Candidatus Delongbacteria bacterium]